MLESPQSPPSFRTPRRAWPKTQHVDRACEIDSLGTVLMDRMAGAIKDAIDGATAARLKAGDTPGIKDTARAELESQRDDRPGLVREIEDVGEINCSREIMESDPTLPREATDVAPGLAGSASLEPANKGRTAWHLPALPHSWHDTLDILRPPRDRDEPFWEWRCKPPEPVLFDPPPRMNSALVHFHLHHHFLQSVIDRCLAVQMRKTKVTG